MMQHGFPVPDGFVVTTDAYRHHIEQCEIGADSTIERIRECLSAAEMPDAVRREVLKAHRALARRQPGALVCAVRSSATAEDTAAASFAGQHATYYYVLDPTSDLSLEPGEVLIAPYIDPAWTPLFLTANAAVVEVGSYLSHAGTVAREYAMPCIVDVRGCMSQIRTGDIVRVDGAAAQVWIVESKGRASSLSD